VAQRTEDVTMTDTEGRGGPAPDGDRSLVEPGFLTLEDVARYLNVSVPQVYALVRSRELPAIKIGGRGVWRVGRQQLQEYIDRLHRETQEWAKAHPLNPREAE
jgi:excisionase family DNA binding protein